jgi:outer membrane receptor protein involved in Fe transport
MESTLRARLAACVAACALTVPVAAAAQETAQRVAIEEIVVTAKQRAQSIQDVPLSITAFSAEGLSARGIADLRDLAAFTPSFQYFSTTGRNETTTIVRGLSPNTPKETRQGVSVFIDGVFASGNLSSLDMSTLERVEVIKGPQSATFGRATYSGAINFITATPEGDRASGRVSIEGNYTEKGDDFGYDLAATLTAPLIANQLWGSVSLRQRDTARISKRPSDGGPVGAEETTGVSAMLFARPSEALSLRLRVAYDKDDDTIPALHVTHVPEWRAAGNTVAAVGRGWLWPRGEVMEPVNGTTDCQANTPFEPSDCGYVRERWFVSGVAEYMLDNGIELSYRGGWYQQDAESNIDFYFRGGGVDPFFGATGAVKSAALYVGRRQEFENHNHQLRILSPSDGRFRWKAGVFYAYEEEVPFATTSIRATNPQGQLRGAEYIENYAGFAGADFDVTEALTLSGELRVEKETVGTDPCTICNSPEQKDSTTDVLPRLTIQYDVTPDVMLYALYAYGTKSARFNTSAPFDFVEPEELDNYEAGVKSTLFGGRATLNLSGYYQDVKNQQFSIQFADPATGTVFTGIQNVGESEVYGAELELRGALTEQWSVYANIGYAHHEYSNDIVPSSGFDRDLLGTGTLNGKTSVNNPRWSGAVGSEFVQPVFGGNMDLVLRGDLLFKSKMYADVANLTYIPSTMRVNLRLGLRTEAWEITGYVNDLFDEETTSGAGTGTSSITYRPAGTSALQRALSLAVPRGREFGLKGVYRF